MGDDNVDRDGSGKGNRITVFAFLAVAIFLVVVILLKSTHDANLNESFSGRVTHSPLKAADNLSNSDFENATKRENIDDLTKRIDAEVGVSANDIEKMKLLVSNILKKNGYPATNKNIIRILEDDLVPASFYSVPVFPSAFPEVTLFLLKFKTYKRRYLVCLCAWLALYCSSMVAMRLINSNPLSGLLALFALLMYALGLFGNGYFAFLSYEDCRDKEDDLRKLSIFCLPYYGFIYYLLHRTVYYKLQGRAQKNSLFFASIIYFILCFVFMYVREMDIVSSILSLIVSLSWWQSYLVSDLLDFNFSKSMISSGLLQIDD